MSDKPSAHEQAIEHLEGVAVGSDWERFLKGVKRENVPRLCLIIMRSYLDGWFMSRYGKEDKK